MKLKTILFLSCLLAFLCVYPAPAAGLQVVASLSDLASIACAVGGNRVEVIAIAKANANPHNVEVFPSYMARVSRAAVYLKCGLALDQWADAIIDGSRNNHIIIADCSEGVRVLDKPTGKVDASKGDLHPDGNPHYWLNPENGLVIAENIRKALIKADPEGAAAYEKNLETFKSDCLKKAIDWKTRLSPFRNRPILTYHSSWAYFADYFDLPIAANIEPLPGIPPTGNHLAKLVSLIQSEHIAFIISEPYFSTDAASFLNKQTGIPVFNFAPSCEGADANAYFSHFETMVNAITATRN